MKRQPSLHDELQRLQAASNRHGSGVEFQSLIAQLFRREHFRVKLNARTAQPRQTDLVATKGQEVYLVETKWKQRPADINDMDSLFSRLERTEASVVGLMVSFKGFSQTAINAVESRRSRPVLLLDGVEMERLCEWGPELARLLRRKRDRLLMDGKVLLTGDRERRHSVRKQGALPAADRIFVFPDGRRTAWMSCGGDFGPFVFVQELPDIDWVTAGGSGVTLDVAPPAAEEADVLGILGALADMGWASGSGRWSIHQATVNWHGAGGEPFAQALTSWADRYQGLDLVHHTEEFCYQDTCEGGFYTLTGAVSASKPRVVWQADLSFQLTGVPMDPAPFRNLCDSIEADQPLYFRPRHERSVVNGRVALEGRIALTTVGLVVERDEDEPDPAQQDWVVGVVVKNPYRATDGSRRVGAPEWWPSPAEVSEVLICDLRSYHPLTEPRTGYRLWSCEWSWTSDALVIRPRVDWDDEPPQRRASTSGRRKRA